MLKEEILIDSCQDKTSRYVGYHSWYIEGDKILKKNGVKKVYFITICGGKGP